MSFLLLEVKIDDRCQWPLGSWRMQGYSWQLMVKIFWFKVKVLTYSWIIPFDSGLVFFLLTFVSTDLEETLFGDMNKEHCLKDIKSMRCQVSTKKQLLKKYYISNALALNCGSEG